MIIHSRAPLTRTVIALVFCVGFLASCRVPLPVDVATLPATSPVPTHTDSPQVPSDEAPTSVPAAVPPATEPAPLVTPAAATVITVSVPATVTADLRPVESPPPGRYLFIEWREHHHGVGVLWAPPPRIGYPPAPNYYFDPPSGVLEPRGPSLTFTLATGQMGFLGLSHTASGTTSCCHWSKLAHLDTLPQEQPFSLLGGTDTSGQYYWRDATFTVQAVGADGTVAIQIDGRPFRLAPGQRWERIDEVVVATAVSSGVYQERHTITNYGWQ